ncbi:MAG: hypothetical protein Ct9H300mP32_4120 [Verrucomicrobiota bacterium]|nr:MAG: hypothetical protein Ct9H300mP32_4120 [Verrucomicrobiota bacterium]
MSGEYSMVQAAAKRGWGERASGDHGIAAGHAACGADIIVSYAPGKGGALVEGGLNRICAGPIPLAPPFEFYPGHGQYGDHHDGHDHAENDEVFPGLSVFLLNPFAGPFGAESGLPSRTPCSRCLSWDWAFRGPSIFSSTSPKATPFAGLSGTRRPCYR